MVIPHKKYYYESEGINWWSCRYNITYKHQNTMKKYYRMDYKVECTCGVIMKDLERQGENDNTLIIFTLYNSNVHA